MAYGTAKADVIQSSTAGVAPQFNDGNGTQTGTLCRAWVNFNGTGTVAIRASFNVSSITDNGTGDYTVNFTTAMPDANYSLVAAPWNGVNNGSGWAVIVAGITYSTGSIRVYTKSISNQGNDDVAIVSIAVFR